MGMKTKTLTVTLKKRKAKAKTKIQSTPLRLVGGKDFVLVALQFQNEPTKTEVIEGLSKVRKAGKVWDSFSKIPVVGGTLVFRVDNVGTTSKVWECAHSYLFKIGERKVLGYRTSFYRKSRLEFSYNGLV